MQRFSIWALARNALTGHREWPRLWRSPEPKARYSVVIVGVSTSGCVRAAAVDAFSHNFRVTVVEEACADRSAFAHRANLFDIDMKCGDVESLDAVIAELEARFAPGRTQEAAE